jgi:hypothetical protein
MAPILSESKTFSLILNSGRTIRMTDLYLKETYESASEEIPPRSEIVAELEEMAPDLVAGVDSLFILQPDSSQARLPDVVCIAHMISEPLEADDDVVGSGLTVVWFQDRFVFPPTADIIKSLQTLDWDKLADDFED